MSQFESDIREALGSHLRQSLDGRPSSESPRKPHPRVVIMAGGRGTRLAPFTSVLPKPLMPVGDRAILEILIERLASFNPSRITLCVGYLSHLIRAVIDNGAEHGVEVDYVQERERLGTAGPLRLVDGLKDTFLVTNGDILTSLDYEDLLEYHLACGNVLTIATHVRHHSIDYGVLHLHDGPDNRCRVAGFEEKPKFDVVVSMGIYVMEPAVLKYIPDGEYFDFPDLVQRLLLENEPIGAYRFDGYWLDLGRHDDYVEANRVWEHEQHLFMR